MALSFLNLMEGVERYIDCVLLSLMLNSSFTFRELQNSIFIYKVDNTLICENLIEIISITLIFRNYHSPWWKLEMIANSSEFLVHIVDIGVSLPLFPKKL